MKLLRISSDRADGTFQNQINANLLLKPFSQVALSNASFTNDYPVLVLAGNTNIVKYNVSDGAAFYNRSVTIPVGNYVGTDSDAERLFQDVSLAMNSALTLTGKEFGGEFQLNKIAGRITLQYRISPVLLAETAPQGSWNFLNSFEIAELSSSTQIIYQISAGEPTAIADDSCRATLEQGLCRGSGIFRATIQQLKPDATNGAANGFRMVLTDTSIGTLSPTTLTAEENKFALNCLPDPADLTKFKYTFNSLSGNTQDVLDATGAILRPNTPTDGADGFASGTNDVVQFSINGGFIKGQIFQTNGGVQQAFDAFNVPYDGAKLFPVVILRGDASSNTQLYNIELNPREDFNANSLGSSTVTEIHRNSLLIPNQPNVRPSDFKLDLSEAQDLANFIGLNQGLASNRFIYLRPSYISVASFIGASNFSLQTFESYVIQLQSQLLESYDGGSFKSGAGNGAKLGEGGQFSILKVIPNYNQNVDNRVCNYEASNLTFIDLNNKEPILLRNINARILDASLNEIKTQNISILTMLFKENNEVI